MVGFIIRLGVATSCGAGECWAWRVVVNEPRAAARLDDEDYGDEAWVWGSCDGGHWELHS